MRKLINRNFLAAKWIWVLSFSILAFLFIFCFYDFYIRKIESLSLFVPDKQYFMDCMQVAGGLLVYGGSFLTQFFYYPFWGTCVYVFLLITLIFLFVRIYRIPDRFFLLAMLPGMMFILSLTELGYLIYNLKSPGYVYSGILGVMVASGILWSYRAIQNDRFRRLLILGVILVGYPLFGFYTLLGLGLCIVYELGGRNRKHWLDILLILVTIIIIPRLFVTFLYTRMSIHQTYLTGLPDFRMNTKEGILWLPFVMIGIWLLGNLIFLRRYTERKGFSIYALLCWLGSWGMLFGFSYREKNFQVELAMDRAIQENDWEQVVFVTQNTDELPDRLMVMNRNLALQKLGKAGDLMFRYGQESQLSKQRRKVVMLGAKALYWQYGKINFCYRWCMEEMVEYGMKAENLQYMIKCALLNEEYALAQKYNDVLKKTWFYREWAGRYQAYIDDPKLIFEDKEIQSILPLMAYDNVPDEDGNLLEVYLLNHFANMEGGNPQLMELSLQCNLILKNIANFWPRFFLYLRTHDHLPLHYQEAAVLYAQLEGKVDIGRLPVDGQVMKRFGDFLTMSENYAGREGKFTKEEFEKHFRDTFWYYYFFVKGMKTN